MAPEEIKAEKLAGRVDYYSRLYLQGVALVESDRVEITAEGEWSKLARCWLGWFSR